MTWAPGANSVGATIFWNPCPVLTRTSPPIGDTVAADAATGKMAMAINATERRYTTTLRTYAGCNLSGPLGGAVLNENQYACRNRTAFFAVRKGQTGRSL